MGGRFLTHTHTQYMMTLTYIITLGSQCYSDHKSDKWGKGGRGALRYEAGEEITDIAETRIVAKCNYQSHGNVLKSRTSHN
jgi:hypothetical protein